MSTLWPQLEVAPTCCGKRMRPDYTVGFRTCHVCANKCGHRLWTGPIGELKRAATAPNLPLRPCQMCHLNLPAASKAFTKYHRHCREAIKRAQQKAYQLRIAMAALAVGERLAIDKVARKRKAL